MEVDSHKYLEDDRIRVVYALEQTGAHVGIQKHKAFYTSRERSKATVVRRLVEEICVIYDHHATERNKFWLWSIG